MPDTAKPLKNGRSNAWLCCPLSIFPYVAPEWIFLGVIKQKLSGWWRGMKGIIGMTRFTKLGLTITNTIGKFSGDGLGND